MDGCLSVHEHPEFQSSYDPKGKVQNREIQKLKRFLKSDAGHSIGEPLRHELSPFKSFPRKHKSTRCIFILCKNCQKKIIQPNCGFCGSEAHSMNDAVLLCISPAHNEAYQQAKKIVSKFESPPPSSPESA